MACPPEVISLHNTVKDLNKKLAELQEKCKDIEGCMRRCNIRILCVPETSGSSSPASMAKLLTQVLHLNKEPILDHSLRILGKRSRGVRPQVIIAKLHYQQECIEILRRARDRTPH